MRAIASRTLTALTLILLAAPALTPLISPTLARSADGLLHLYRLVEFDRLLHQGIFFSRWFPDLAYGYGLPLLNFYAPLAYYLTEPLHLVGFDFPLALNLSLALALLVGVVGTYLFVDGLVLPPPPSVGNRRLMQAEIGSSRLGLWSRVNSTRTSLSRRTPALAGGARVDNPHTFPSGVVDSTALRAVPLLAAIAYLYSPYLLFNAIHRANLAEAWALGLAPCALWASARWLSAPTRVNFLAATLFYVAVLLSHNITGLLFTPILIGFYLVSMRLKEEERRGNEGGTPPKAPRSAKLVSPRLRVPASPHLPLSPSPRLPCPPAPLPPRSPTPLLFALVLTAFFWLPALVEQSWVQIARVVVTPDFDYRFNFVPLAELVSLLPRADTGRMNPALPATLGAVQVLLGAAAVGLFASKKLIVKSIKLSVQDASCHSERSEESSPRHAETLRSAQGDKGAESYLSTCLPVSLLLFTFSFFLFTFLTLSSSQFIWDHVPFLAFVQHPARLRGLAALALAPIVGAAIIFIPARWRQVGAGLAITTLILTALPMLYPRANPSVPPDPSLVTMFAYEKQSGAIGTTSFGEYLPVWVQSPPDHSPLEDAYRAGETPNRFVFPDAVEVKELGNQAIGQSGNQAIGQSGNQAIGQSGNQAIRQSGNQAIGGEAEVVALADFRALFRAFYFPGWRVTIDGRETTIIPTARDGLISFDVPAGAHRIVVEFGETNVRVVADAVSVASLLAMMGFLAAGGKLKGKGEKEKVEREKEEGKSEKEKVKSENGADDEKAAVSHLPLRAVQGLRAVFAKQSPLLLLAIALLVFKVAYVDRVDSVFRVQFDGTHVAGVEHLLAVDFGGQMRLLGFNAAGCCRAGDTVQMDLFWRGEQNLTTNYSTFVHLVDAEGRVVAQKDSLHPANLPTTQWETNAYAVDAHRLTIPRGLPRGVYTLIVGVYDPATGLRLTRASAPDARFFTSARLLEIMLEP